MDDVVEVKITWKGKEGVVKLRRLKFGEYMKAMQKSTKMRMVGNVPTADVDFFTLRWEMLKMSIVEAPFEVNDKNLAELDINDGLRLLEVSDELNSFQEEQNSEGNNGNKED